MTRTDAWSFRGRRLSMPMVGRVMGGMLRAIVREYRLRRQVAFLMQQDQRMLTRPRAHPRRRGTGGSARPRPVTGEGCYEADAG